MTKRDTMFLTFISLIFLLVLTLSQTLMAQSNCPKLSGLTASSITDESTQLSWQGSVEHTIFTVDLKNGTGTPNFKYSPTTGKTEKVVEDLQRGSEYRFRVKSQWEKWGSGGSSQWFKFSTTLRHCGRLHIHADQYPSRHRL